MSLVCSFKKLPKNSSSAKSLRVPERLCFWHSTVTFDYCVISLALIFLVFPCEFFAVNSLRLDLSSELNS